jgi:tryptophanyl-tRNA synthetase
MSDDNVIDLHAITTLDIPPARVWQACLDKNITPAIAIGYDENGELYFASSAAHAGEVLLLLELAKGILMRSK